jgi:hypothetical protein
MPTSPATRSRVKPRLSFRLVPGLPGEKPLLEVCEHKKKGPVFAWYYLSPLGGAYAPAWALTKSACTDGTDPTERSYEVLCEGGVYSCTCKGSVRHGHCRHASGVEQLRKDGLL